MTDDDLKDRARKAMARLRFLESRSSEHIKQLAEGLKVRCNFCGRTRDEVKTLVGSADVYICDRCVDYLYDQIHQRDPG